MNINKTQLKEDLKMLLVAWSIVMAGALLTLAGKAIGGPDAIDYVPAGAIVLAGFYLVVGVWKT